MLFLPAVLALSGCGTGLTREQVIEYGETAYSGIVSFLVVGYQGAWDEMSPEEMNLSPVYSYSSPYAGYSTADINGDGFDEMVIGDQFEDGSYSLYDIYRFDARNASLIHLASGGERDTFVVTADGTIVETGSNSAEDSFTKGFKVKGNKLVEVKKWEDSLMAFQFERFSDLARPQQLCGGFTDQREPSEEEVELFKSVTGESGMTFTVLSVSTQVVAGINYKFWCRYQDKDDSGHCWVTVFKPLPGQGDPKVLSIEKENQI